MAGSIALIGFGIDSAIEGFASVVIVWRFTGWRTLSHHAEERAQKLVAVQFFLLAPYVAFESIRMLVNGTHAEESLVGIALAASSLVLMPLLGRAKQRIGDGSGRPLPRAKASRTSSVRTSLAALLVELLGNALVGAWWLDPLVGLFIAVVAVVEGREAWRGDACCTPLGAAGSYSPDAEPFWSGGGHVHDADVRAGAPWAGLHPRLRVRVSAVKRLWIPSRHVALRCSRGHMGGGRAKPLLEYCTERSSYDRHRPRVAFTTCGCHACRPAFPAAPSAPWRAAMQASDDPQRYEAAICDHARAITRADAVHRAWAAEGSPVTAAGGSTGHALFAGTVRQVATTWTSRPAKSISRQRSARSSPIRKPVKAASMMIAPI